MPWPRLPRRGFARSRSGSRARGASARQIERTRSPRRSSHPNRSPRPHRRLRPSTRCPTAPQVEAPGRAPQGRARTAGRGQSRRRDEAEEVQEKLDLMVTDRDDLIEAIAKLRGGIQSLNREGRERLNEAFDKVNEPLPGALHLAVRRRHGRAAVRRKRRSARGRARDHRPAARQEADDHDAALGRRAGAHRHALIFAVFLTNPAPICVLDEVDAPLDDANVERFCNLLDRWRAHRDALPRHHPQPGASPWRASIGCSASPWPSAAS
jgi:chromosome segregation protein